MDALSGPAWLRAKSPERRFIDSARCACLFDLARRERL